VEIRSRRLAPFVIAGLALRLPGLFVNGEPDGFEIILDWGADVAALGLGQGISRSYGAVSFALFGWAADWAMAIPRFWWLPFKVLEVAENKLSVRPRVSFPNTAGCRLCYGPPWFIWHGAYQVWEGPYIDY
jgi:hypothetical protein